MRELKAEGELKVGDRLKIIGKNKRRDSYKSITVKGIIDNGYGEEVTINKSRNYYFMTRVYLEGKGGVKRSIFYEENTNTT